MIERIYNIILWRIYSFLRGTTKLLNGINPFTWLLQIPFIKKIIIKRGGSIEQIEAAADHVTNDPIICAHLFFVEYKDKYLKYFKTFEKQSLTWKITWGIISFLFVITPIILIIMG